MLTRVDGDGRGGAALSMRAVTGKPIKLIGVGEKLDALEDFHPERIAGRILGMGDVVSLVEKAAQTVEHREGREDRREDEEGRLRPRRPRRAAEADAEARRHGRRARHAARRRQDQEADRHDANLDDSILKRQQAIIGSMTRAGAPQPEVLDASRKKRVAAGSGTKVQDINKLVKMHRQMADMMKAMGKKRGLLGAAVRRRTAAGASRRAAGWRGAASRLAPACRLAASWLWRRPAARPSRIAWHAPRPSRPAGIEETMNLEIIREGRDMSLKIRLARAGAKKRPYYRIVVADSRSPRDGRYIEKVGTYNPLLPKDSAERVKLVEDRIKHWLGVGAQPTDRVLRFLDEAGIAKRDARSNPNKGQPGKKRVEREEAKVAAAAEKAKAAAEAAAAPPPAPEPAPEAEQPTAE